VEDGVKDGYYVLRAELPGVDPEKDIDVTVSGGVLTIKAEKHEAMEASTDRSSATAPSSAAFRCRSARMKTTSRRRTATACWR
jgi:HSP20 family molecular chaperone IbpA